jgi:RsiW-degrading membrane proteinase PrsW (M82 family)
MLLATAGLDRLAVGFPGLLAGSPVRDAVSAFVVAGLFEEAVKLWPVSVSLRDPAPDGLESRKPRPGGPTDAESGTGGPGVARPEAARAEPGGRRDAGPPRAARRAGSRGSAGPAGRGRRGEAARLARKDTALVAATAGLGFAFAENAFYVLGSASLLLARALLAVPLHAATAVMLGVAIAGGGPAGRRGEPGARRGAEGRPARQDVGLPPALILAVALHGAYDLAARRAVWAAPFVVVVAVVLAVVVARRGGETS